ncbi:hypothetical protein FACS1894170_11220 [Planctomycetales bacterium]|nr:hypothetical protein FACS1894170_11220 [Planctomycetales bacterium]
MLFSALQFQIGFDEIDIPILPEELCLDGFSFRIDEWGTASERFHKEVDTVWSYRANAQGQLVYDSYALSDIDVKSEGSYDYHAYDYSAQHYAGITDSVGNSVKMDEADLINTNTHITGFLNTSTESRYQADTSEFYRTERHEVHEARNGGSFSLVSADGSAASHGSSSTNRYDSRSTAYNLGWTSQILRTSRSINGMFASSNDSETEKNTQTSYETESGWQKTADGLSSYSNNRTSGLGTTHSQRDYSRTGYYYSPRSGNSSSIQKDWSTASSSDTTVIDFEYETSTHCPGGVSGVLAGGGLMTSSRSPSGLSKYSEPSAPDPRSINAPAITFGQPGFGNYLALDPHAELAPEIEVPETAAPILSNITTPSMNDSWWWAGTKAFFGSLGTSFYDAGNHLSFGSLDSQRYDAQVDASGERLYNVAKNLGYSDKSIAGGLGLAQALAGEVVGTNNLAEGIAGYDLGTNTLLDDEERFGKIAQGTGQIAGTLAIGVKLPAETSLPKNLNYSGTVAKHMTESSRYVPQAIIKDVIRYGRPVADSQGTQAKMYYHTLWKNGKSYTIEVLYDRMNNKVLHVLYHN